MELIEGNGHMNIGQLTGRTASLLALVLIAGALGACEETTPGTDGGTDSGPGTDTGPGTDSGPITGDILVRVGPTEIAPGSEYAPLAHDGIPPYSMAVQDFTIDNQSDAAVVIDSVTITGIVPSEDEEWNINEPGTTSRAPIVVEDETIAAGESFDFGTFFFPFASGPRNATITITHGGSTTYAFTLVARGRDNATLSPVAETAIDRLYGLRTTTSLIGGAVSDAEGNLYLSQNVNEWGDGFSENIVVARVNADATLGWSHEWNEDYEQLQPDPGQNAESGGAAESIAFGSEGAVYIAGQRSQSSSNSVFQGMVARIATDDGALVWARGITRGTNAVPSTAAQSVRAYAVDATLTDRVLVTGQVADNSGLLFAALSKTDGALLWAYEVDLAAGSVDRGYSVVADASGNVFVAGLTDGRAFIMKLSGASTATPAIDWARRVDLGVGSPINSLALDGSGGVFAGLDVRGATTAFAVAHFDGSGGTLWAKVWDATNTGDNNNVHVVREVGGEVYVGGRIAFQPFDTQFGEGFMMNLDAATGAYNWASFYYTGKGTEEIMEHRIKAIVPRTGGVWVLQQGYPGPNNGAHYAGRWYQANDDTLELPGGDGSLRLEDFTITATAIAGAALTAIPSGTGHVIDASSIWTDPPAEVDFMDPGEREGNNGRGFAFIEQVAVTP